MKVKVGEKRPNALKTNSCELGWIFYDEISRSWKEYRFAPLPILGSKLKHVESEPDRIVLLCPSKHYQKGARYASVAGSPGKKSVTFVPAGSALNGLKINSCFVPHFHFRRWHVCATSAWRALLVVKWDCASSMHWSGMWLFLPVQKLSTHKLRVKRYYLGLHQ
jgi:hypothetical protein